MNDHPKLQIWECQAKNVFTDIHKVVHRQLLSKESAIKFWQKMKDVEPYVCQAYIKEIGEWCETINFEPLDNYYQKKTQQYRKHTNNPEGDPFEQIPPGTIFANELNLIGRVG